MNIKKHIDEVASERTLEFCYLKLAEELLNEK